MPKRRKNFSKCVRVEFPNKAINSASGRVKCNRRLFQTGRERETEYQKIRLFGDQGWEKGNTATSEKGYPKGTNSRGGSYITSENPQKEGEGRARQNEGSDISNKLAKRRKKRHPGGQKRKAKNGFPRQRLRLLLTGNRRGKERESQTAGPL